MVFRVPVEQKKRGALASGRNIDGASARFDSLVGESGQRRAALIDWLEITSSDTVRPDWRWRTYFSSIAAACQSGQDSRTRAD